MTSAREIELLEEMNAKLIGIAKSKGNDYASEDVLSNFKIVSSVIDLLKIDTRTPEGYALLMVILKICRIGNLLQPDKVVSNEGIADSFEDGINYFKLAYLCYKEKTDEHPTVGNGEQA